MLVKAATGLMHVLFTYPTVLANDTSIRSDK